MIALWIVCAVAVIILFLLFLNIHLIFDYHEKASITLKVLFFRFDAIDLFRKFSNKGNKDESAADSDAAKENDQPEEKKAKRKGDFLGFLNFLKHIAQVIGLGIKEHFSKAKVDLQELKISIGTEDAAETALLCGTVIQAANGFCALLQRFSNFRCDDRNLSISPDFLSEQSHFSLHLVISSRLVYILGVVLRTYIRFFEGKEDNHARNSVKTGH